MDRVVHDLRFAVRTLRRNPGFALVVVLTLGLGIGANSAVFGVVNAVLLRPLPYMDADRLVIVESTRSGDEISVAYPDLLDWRASARTFEALAGFVGTTVNLTGGGEAERLAGQVVTSDLFRTIGVEPALGRGFLAEEDRPGAARVAVLSHALWTRRFGEDPSIIGRGITLDGEPYTVVGIMPRGFDFPGGIVYDAADLWLPAGLHAAEWDSRDSHPGIVAIGRLRPDVSIDAARAELTAVAERLAAEYPDTNRDEGVIVRGALERLVGDARPALLMLLGAVGLVLLIACVNVANLLLARASARGREIAVRTALGASRSRIASLLAVESLVLAAGGAAAGLLLATWGVAAAAPLLASVPRLDAVPIDGRVLAFTGGVAVATAALFGLAPIATLARDRADRWLRDRGGAGDAGTGRARAALVVSQIALAVVLLIGAGLLVKSFGRLQALKGGIEPEGVLTFATSLPEGEYAEGDAAVRFHRVLEERISALPGVVEVGAISVLPFSGAGWQTRMTVPGVDMEPHRTDVALVTPGYFRAMGVELLRGRLFDERDDDASSPVAIVDERLAERFWPGEDPIGKRVSGWGYPELIVVGVVGHVTNYGVTAASREELFVPHALRPGATRLYTIVRTEGDPTALASVVRRTVAALDPNLPIYGLRPMRDVVAQTVATPRLAATLSGAFAAIAMLLAVVGIYGVMAYTVSRRSREIGIRMALGADAGMVFRQVLRQALVLAGAGAALGIAGAFGASRLLASQLYGTSATDPVTFALIPLALVAVALAASAAPALRAARVAPAVVLSEE